jgi:hypothetical protein
MYVLATDMLLYASHWEERVSQPKCIGFKYRPIDVVTFAKTNDTQTMKNANSSTVPAMAIYIRKRSVSKVHQRPTLHHRSIKMGDGENGEKR